MSPDRGCTLPQHPLQRNRRADCLMDVVHHRRARRRISVSFQPKDRVCGGKRRTPFACWRRRQEEAEQFPRYASKCCEACSRDLIALDRARRYSRQSHRFSRQHRWEPEIFYNPLDHAADAAVIPRRSQHYGRGVASDRPRCPSHFSTCASRASWRNFPAWLPLLFSVPSSPSWSGQSHRRKRQRRTIFGHSR